MILIDTSVWIDHFRNSDSRLTRLLGESLVVTHPFVIGEIALGSLKDRGCVVACLAHLPSVLRATDQETLAFIEGVPLFGTGIGYLDAHLLASVRLTPGATIWTRDRRLGAAAAALGLAA